MRSVYRRARQAALAALMSIPIVALGQPSAAWAAGPAPQPGNTQPPGTAGLLTMREAGARTIGQSAASCVVFGMPRMAQERGACEEMLPVETIARKALQLCSR